MERDDHDDSSAELLVEIEGLRAQNAALLRRNASLEASLGFVPDAVSMKDLQGRYVIVNAAGARLFGKPAEEVVGGDDSELLPPSAAREAMSADREVIAGEGIKVFEHFCLSPEGPRLCLTGTEAHRDDQGHVVGVIRSTRDVTENRRTEDALEESRRRFQAIFENNLDAISLTDDSLHYVDVNPAMCDLLGYSRDEILQLTVLDITAVESRHQLPELFARLRAHGTLSGVYPLLCKNGAIREVEYRAVANILPGLHLGVLRDITERKRAEQALHTYAKRLKVLSRRVVEVQEEERRHLARELHDEIGQSLTAIGINLKALRINSNPNLHPRLEDCIAIVHDATDQVRQLSLNLRPAMLDDLGLVAALRWHLDRQAQRVGYMARFIASPEEASITPAVATTAFRVAQEALTNVARHAQARRVWLRLRIRKTSLSLVVRDDGTGFDSRAMRRRDAAAAGLGLLGMHERAALLDGRVAVRSVPGRGTEVRMTIPLSPTPERG